MLEAKYDAIAQEYHETAKASFQNPNSIGGLAVHSLIAQVGEVTGKSLCDIGCGDGHLLNYFAEQGAKAVGVDLSEKLLEFAREQFPEREFICDDAQKLNKLSEASFDIVVSNFALMDMPDLQAVYQAVWRILKAGGRFVFTLTHPCFQAPHSDLLLEEGKFSARIIKQYNQEGAWKSTFSEGIRGRVGANHRRISSYLNGLIEAKFSLLHLAEPCLPAGDYESPFMQSLVEIPSILLLDVRK